MNIHHLNKTGNLLVLLLCLTCTFLNAAEGSPIELQAPITLESAIGKAIKSNPALAVAHTEIAVRRARERQAGLPPNPRLSYEIEDFGGEGEFSGLRSLEQKTVISQEIELGGKRGRRKAVAAQGRTMAELEYRVAYLDLLAKVESLFFVLLTAQRLDSLAAEKVRLAHQVYNTVYERVKAGKVSPVELARAEVVLSRAAIETGRTAAQLNSARQRLAASWGAGEAAFGRAVGDFETLQQPLELPVLLERLENSPDMMLARQSLAIRMAEENLEAAHRFPNLEFSAGVKSMRDSGNRAFVAEVGIPLPLFNRNQGRLEASRQNVVQAGYEVQGEYTELVTELTATHAGLKAAYSEAISMRDRVVAGAERVFAAIRIGYIEGKFGYIELLDAQRSLFEARGSYLDALRRYHLGRISTNRLLGNGGQYVQPNDRENNNDDR